MIPARRRRSASRLWAGFIALAASMLPVAPAAPLLAQSDTDAAAAPAAVAADAADEIVYVDNAGFVRVLDPQAGGSGPEVKWVSPEASFNEVALGDFNNDTDMEIIAIKGNPGQAGRVVIYDPVVAFGITVPGQEINGIPWVTLLDLTVPFRPILVGAGNFDAGVPGDEFFVVTEVPEGSRPEADDLIKLDIYKQTSQTPDGRTWVPHITNRYFEESWERVAVGDVVPGNTEEFALADEDTGKFAVYRVDGGMVRLTEAGDSRKPFRDVAMGDWDGDDALEVAAVRDAIQPLASLFVFDWTGNDFEEDVATAYDPAFRRVTFSDVNGSGDDELFLLRNTPGGSDKPRLISRNNGSDNTHEWSVQLEDNEWRALADGDIEGDGRGEIIIARTDRIRIFFQPERDNTTYQDYTATTNRRSLLAGNLDTIGFSKGPLFVLSTNLVELSLPAGMTGSATLRLRNGGTTAAVPFATSFEGSTPWVTASPASGSTPANSADAVITLNFNAGSLLPGVYRARIFFTSSADVVNDPVSAAITLTVTPAALSASPGNINISGVCTGSGAVSTTVQVRVIGSEGLSYSAAIVEAPILTAAVAQLGGPITGAALQADGSVLALNESGASVQLPTAMSSPSAGGIIPDPFTWLTATNASGVIVDTITMQVANPTPFTETVLTNLLLVGGPLAGTPPQNIRVIPLNICPASVIHFPVVAR